jgi:hypothetical protein
MTMVNVTKENYRIVEGGHHGKILAEFDDYSTEIYWEAFKFCGTRKHTVAIERVTHWQTPIEGCQDAFMCFCKQSECGKYYVGEKVTGVVWVGPEHFSSDVELSRYNPVNGWEIPEMVEL